MVTIEDIEELERFFNSVDIPLVMKPNPGVTCFNTPQFIQNSLIVLKEGNLKGFYAEVRYNDLLQLRKLLEQNKADDQWNKK